MEYSKNHDDYLFIGWRMWLTYVSAKKMMQQNKCKYGKVDWEE